MKEPKQRTKSPHEFITDGVLAYGVNVGRFVFEEEGYTVYAISDLPHIGPSDVLMMYQISKADYEKLLSLARKGEIPKPPVTAAVTDACRQRFLCGESAYCTRYRFALKDADKLLAERTAGGGEAERPQPAVMHYCPNCGRKNEGNRNYCTACGTKLLTGAGGA